MRATHVLAGTLFALLGAAVPALAEPSIRWQTSLDSAKRVAEQNGQLVLVHFWAPYCGACTRMEREVFTQPNVVGAIHANYVPVKLNAEYFPATVQQYSVTALPSDVIITPQGQLVSKFEGLVRAPDYVSRLNQVAATARSQNSPVYAQAQPPVANPSQGAMAGPGGAPLASAGPDPRVAAAPGGEIAALVGPRYANAAPAVGGPPPAAPNLGPAPAVTPPPGMPNAAGPTMGPPPMAGTMGPTGAMAGAMGPTGAMGPMGPQSPPAAGIAPNGPAATARPQVAAPATPQIAAQPAPQIAPQVAPPVVPQAPALAAPGAAATLALDGYCPVTLVEQQRWQPGDRRFGAVHRGRTYLFASPEEQRRFLSQPDNYAPVLSGMDLVIAIEQNRAVPGLRQHGGYYERRVYLFADEQSLQKFSADPERYIRALLQAMRPTALN